MVLMGRKIYSEKRPWGKFEQFALNEKCTVKIITVKARQSLSLQSHKKRAELWVAIDSGLKAQVNKKIVSLKKGQRIFIPKGARHRLKAGKRAARVLEISFGYFDEKDEIRFEDAYGRV